MVIPTNYCAIFFHPLQEQIEKKEETAVLSQAAPFSPNIVPPFAETPEASPLSSSPAVKYLSQQIHRFRIHQKRCLDSTLAGQLHFFPERLRVIEQHHL